MSLERIPTSSGTILRRELPGGIITSVEIELPDGTIVPYDEFVRHENTSRKDTSIVVRRASKRPLIVAALAGASASGLVELARTLL